jgi:hypothetical protein
MGRDSPRSGSHKESHRRLPITEGLWTEGYMCQAVIGST